MRPEIRTCKMEIRAFDKLEDAGSFVEGYGVTWELPENYDWYGTIFNRNAFTDDIAKRGPQGSGEIINKWRHRDPFGMPEVLQDDDTGIWLRAIPSDTAENKERMTYVRDRVVSGLSISFQSHERKVHDDIMTRWGWPVEEIMLGTLGEISPVMDPAVQNAKITDARSYRQRQDGMWVPDERETATTYHFFGQRNERAELEKIHSAIGAYLDASDTKEEPPSAAEPSVLEAIAQLSAAIAAPTKGIA